MKTYGKLVALIVAVLVVGMGAYAEAATDKTVSVSMTASIAGVTSMSVSPSTMAFASTGADAFATTPTGGKIVITYASNYNPWKIDIYTNNTQVPKMSVDPVNGKYSKGGLATASGKSVVACKWVAKNPASAAPAIGTIGGYNFVKDLNDEDDPITTAYDESWAVPFAQGYANIAFGSGTTGYCVDPTKLTPPETKYRGEAITNQVAVYVAGLFATGGVTPAVPASAGDYISTLAFDLYHE